MLLLATACRWSAELPLAPLPTAAAVAQIPSSLAAIDDPSAVPPTWTPEATATMTANRILRSEKVIEQPTVRPTIPTNTPVPPTATPTPLIVATPTATRYVSYIPQQSRTDELGPSKLSVHVLRNNSPDIMNFVRQARPSVIKGIGDFGFLAEVKEISPQTVIIGRIDDIYIQNYIGEPEEAAQEYVEKHLATYQANPYVDFWEGWNEPDPPTADLMMWYARFEQERVKLMAAHGLRSAIGGFPQGTPELHEFRLFVPAIETTLQYQGILTLHEGDLASGDLRHLYGDPLPGYPSYPDRGSGAFRYRWFYKEVLEPAGLVIPLVISELNFEGWGSSTEEEMLEQFAWYDAGVRQDGYVIGFTIFTAGSTGYWRRYDINRILPELTDYVVAQR